MKRRVIQRRVVVFLLLLLAGGAIVNVAVAWGLAVGVDDWKDAASIKQMRIVLGGRDISPARHVAGQCWSLMSVFNIDLHRLEIGWPCRGMHSIFKTIQRDSEVASAVLKLRPIWPGFAINTIFYAAILWVVFFVPGMVRRRIRRNRGLCPACAYPICTSPVCTECGTPFPSPLRGRVREGVERVASRNAQNEVERPTHPLAPSLKGGGKDSA